MQTREWYGVRTVYEHTGRREGADRLYEERVVLVLAASDDEALAKAEAEAKGYASEDVAYLGLATSFRMFEGPNEMAEVFSLMRDSSLEPRDYLDTFFDTGRERTR